MIIEELRNRHRELLARKKEELSLQAEGRGDNLALFMVQEELLEVNAQLRALSARHRVGSKRGTPNDFAVDRQQYINWDRENQSFDDEVEENHQAMLGAVSRSWGILTPRQREIMQLAQTGVAADQIAIQLGVNRSTVYRTLGRAKRSMREEAERSLQEQTLNAKHLDMSDANTAKVILSAVTPKQAVYLYLYYSEWMSLREISNLTGTDHSSIYRTLQRALRNIGSVLGYQETVLENMNALDDLAYRLYSEIQDQDDIVPAEIRPQKSVCGHIRKTGFTLRTPAFSPTDVRLSDLPPITIRTASGYFESVIGGLGHYPSKNRKRGRLLQALLERNRKQSSNRSIMSWLTAVFCRVAGKHEKRGGRWWARIFSRRGSRN
jgi:DNA-directed RNA polymerase specialized sigma24 family protein|uniref:Helix-turn-helix protein n=1 Tax=Siphoviridae sp. ctP6113 TaxID=2826318 RepID=A0A8S5MU60_9CAUD|nr:MAG TPA: helix-turn-helix protein [Siphoviridae sp. ctP6113]